MWIKRADEIRRRMRKICRIFSWLAIIVLVLIMCVSISIGHNVLTKDDLLKIAPFAALFVLVVMCWVYVILFEDKLRQKIGAYEEKQEDVNRLEDKIAKCKEILLLEHPSLVTHAIFNDVCWQNMPLLEYITGFDRHLFEADVSKKLAEAESQLKVLKAEMDSMEEPNTRSYVFWKSVLLVNAVS